METLTPPPRKKSKAAKFEDYDGFVEKYKAKKTTDDCYTPEPVYNAIVDWIDKNIMSLDGVCVVRPFWPDNDYEKVKYPDGCVVIDNPPFSILAKIRRFYLSKGIRYFLFGPTLTLNSAGGGVNDVKIICGVDIIYHNGAKIPTSFYTNLDCGGAAILVSGSLTKAISKAQDCGDRRPPKYRLPMNVATSAILQKIAAAGVDLLIPATDCHCISTIDSMKAAKKSLFGSGWLLSERAAAERAAAERSAEREAIEWSLSEREWEIVRSLGKE